MDLHRRISMIPSVESGVQIRQFQYYISLALNVSEQGFTVVYMKKGSIRGAVLVNWRAVRFMRKGRGGERFQEGLSSISMGVRFPSAPHSTMYPFRKG